MRPLVFLLLVACGQKSGDTSDSAPVREVTEAQESAALRAEREAALNASHPLHGLVSRPQLIVRQSADPEANPVGWLRWGERIRLKRERTTTDTCNSGWHEIAPRGFVCVGQGITVGDSPPSFPEGEEVEAARRDAPLPYLYYFVKDVAVAQYHNPPSRDQQRAAQTWSDRYQELLANNENAAARFWRGELGPDSLRHASIKDFLPRGFFIAGTNVVTRSQRRFVRTTGGGFVKESQLETRSGHDFAGVELGEDRQLPVVWTVRASAPMVRNDREDGTVRWTRDETIPPIERQVDITSLWQGEERIGDQIYHRIGDSTWAGPRYIRHHFVAVAEKIDPPFRLEDESESWVHVDLSSQTLVVYRGTTPVYATLVSTGLPGHDTPEGVFTIRQKMITDTMANLGPEAGDDAYRIQDVPWTQYFDGSIALHTAFWHTRFGLQRSHGCVNLAPQDAHRIFQETWPRVPDGWHGVSTDRTGFRGSRVVVTR